MISLEEKGKLDYYYNVAFIRILNNTSSSPLPSLRYYCALVFTIRIHIIRHGNTSLYLLLKRIYKIELNFKTVPFPLINVFHIVSKLEST